jgi:hypothetical protein
VCSIVAAAVLAAGVRAHGPAALRVLVGLRVAVGADPVQVAIRVEVRDVREDDASCTGRRRSGRSVAGSEREL